MDAQELAALEARAKQLSEDAHDAGLAQQLFAIIVLLAEIRDELRRLTTEPQP